VAHPVVGLAFFLVGQDLLGGLYLLELLLGVGIVADVGVVLAGFLPVGRLDLLLAGVPGDAQHLVEVLAHSLWSVLD